MTATELTVNAAVTVTLSKVEWDYLDTEDYYVYRGAQLLGIVGVDPNTGRWTASAREGAVQAQLGRRSYSAQKHAVRALLFAEAQTR